ncbi:MAG: type I restriction-modification system subunit M [Acidobacteriota bacterium]|nr:type I restriction-modification system subunit M [Acidobacteriota bacterium]
MPRPPRKVKEPLTPKAQLSGTIKTARDIMRKDAGLNGDLDRIPQLSWILFLKCFDDLEKRREITEKKYRPAIDNPYRWRDWAADPVRGATGEGLLEFINGALLPYLRGLHGEGKGDARDVLAAVFKETYNRMLSGYLLRDVVNLVSRINFNSSDDIHTLGHLYESMLREMRDAAGDSGEFYTPRPLIRFIVQQVAPRLGETVLDPAAGTGGFLVEAFEELKGQVKKVEDERLLKEKTLFGIEKKPMAYLLGMMNLLLHGIDQPQLRRDNALKNPLTQIPESARYNVIVTNPPLGGEEEKGIQDNFPESTRTSETTLLFLQFIMRSLKAGGRCGMVVPNGVLFGDGVAARTKKDLVEDFNLHTIVRLPNGVFAPYTSIPTNLLFFEKTRATKEVWYYEQPLPEGRKNYSKTMAMRFEEFAECQAWWGGPLRKARSENARAWSASIETIVDNNYNLDLKNPNRTDDLSHLSPEQLVEDILAKERRVIDLLGRIQLELSENHP